MTSINLALAQLDIGLVVSYTTGTGAAANCRILYRANKLRLGTCSMRRRYYLRLPTDEALSTYCTADTTIFICRLFQIHAKQLALHLGFSSMLAL